jgi:hypothetical protein
MSGSIFRTTSVTITTSPIESSVQILKNGIKHRLALSNKKGMLQIEDLNQKFEEFQMACKTILPGVDWRLIEDLICTSNQ